MSVASNLDTIFAPFSENLWKQSDEETSSITS